MQCFFPQGNWKMNKELLKGHLPLLILGLLEECPLHGYAICEAVKERYAGSFKLGEGTLYPLLYRLERKGHIKGKWEAGPNGRERKVYNITPSGKREIHRGQKEWKSLIQLFRDVLGEDWRAV